MSTVLIEIRRAKASDAAAVADTHDEAWTGPDGRLHKGGPDSI